MSGPTLAPYVSDEVDAGLELRALGLKIAAYFIEHMQHAASKSGIQPYWTADELGVYQGRTLRRTKHLGCFIIYVIESERDGSRRVTLMLAAPAADFAVDADIWAVLRPRLKDFCG
jgi:hypothetical protein